MGRPTVSASRRSRVHSAALAVVLLLTGIDSAMGQPAELAELRRLAGAEGGEAQGYLAALPPSARLELAKLAAADADPEISAAGIMALVEAAHLEEAVPALSTWVAAGDDLTAFGYAWAHGDDPQLPVRIYLRICRYQLAVLDRFEPVQRANVERFLSDGGYVEPLPGFSRTAVERRLARIEARLGEPTGVRRRTGWNSGGPGKGCLGLAAGGRLRGVCAP